MPAGSARATLLPPPCRLSAAANRRISILGTKASSIDNCELDMPGEDYATTEEEWDRHRDDIARLYLIENRPLRKVQQVMEAKFGFRATSVGPLAGMAKSS